MLGACHTCAAAILMPILSASMPSCTMRGFFLTKSVPPTAVTYGELAGKLGRMKHVVSVWPMPDVPPPDGPPSLAAHSVRERVLE